MCVMLIGTYPTIDLSDPPPPPPAPEGDPYEPIPYEPIPAAPAPEPSPAAAPPAPMVMSNTNLSTIYGFLSLTINRQSYYNNCK